MAVLTQTLIQTQLPKQVVFQNVETAEAFVKKQKDRGFSYTIASGTFLVSGGRYYKLEEVSLMKRF